VNATPPHLSIIVPTYREVDNLDPLCRRTFAATTTAGITAEMIIVDDDSQDGSQTLVATLARDFEIRMVTRHGARGLGSAVLRGFEEARWDTLLVMDADLSHPPERIPAVAGPVFSGQAEFAIGSRYVPGGALQQWPWHRRLASLAATLPARWLVPVRDPMAGFFCLPRAVWQQADRLNPVGYKIGLELLVKARCRKIVEVPIVFADRQAGLSKLDFKQQLLYLRHLVGLYVYCARRWLTGS
jgi:dolichol-phosphate mannosyltransferase